MSVTKQAKQTIQLTQEGLEELKQEVEELVNVKLPKVIERVSSAREQGDLSENADYQSARDEQTFIQARISEIQDIIARAKVIKQTTSHVKVGMGSVVAVKVKGRMNKKFSYQIVGEFGSDPAEGKISSVSPIGLALMGKKKGDQVVVKAPAGDIAYTILNIK